MACARSSGNWAWNTLISRDSFLLVNQISFQINVCEQVRPPSNNELSARVLPPEDRMTCCTHNHKPIYTWQDKDRDAVAVQEAVATWWLHRGCGFLNQFYKK
jgi:hypothetical protein